MQTGAILLNGAAKRSVIYKRPNIASLLPAIAVTCGDISVKRYTGLLKVCT